MHRRRGREEENEALLKAIKALTPGPNGLRDLTAAELVFATGLPEPEILALLPGLATRCGARVAATAAGQVLWRFPADIDARWRRTALRRLGAFLGRNSRRMAELLLKLGYSFWALAAYVLLRSWKTDFSPSRQGRRYSFYDLLLSFVFGDPDPDAAEPEIEGRRFLAWASERRGIVSAAEYALFWGLDRESAEESLARFAGEYGGLPRAIDAGILAWEFPGPSGPGHEALWHRMLHFSNNPASGNAAIVFSSFANLGFGLLTLKAIASWWALDAAARSQHEFLAALVTISGLAGPGTVALLLGILPCAAAAFGLGIPLVRRLRMLAENAGRRRANDRIAVGRTLLAAGGSLQVGAAVSAGAKRGRKGLIHRARGDRLALRRQLDVLAADFRAELDGMEDGTIAYRFDELARELRALDEARSAAIGPGPDGEGRTVIFDSGEAISRD
ncbi:MAG TPA: hypothetical protein VMC79_11285 [Rectinemataceae bacterium]|nr:hypothetical protein [Rectinemataceae bacterium]